MRSTALFQFRSVTLNPTIDGRMIDRESPFPHHFFEVAIAECIAQIPAHTQQNEVGLEMELPRNGRVGEEKFGIILLGGDYGQNSTDLHAGRHRNRQFIYLKAVERVKQK